MGDRHTSFTVESRMTPDALSQLHQASLSRRRSGFRTREI